MSALEQFRQIIKEIKQYEEALAVLYWDLRTGAPRKGMDTRSEVIGTLSGKMFELSTSKELGMLLTELEVETTFKQLSELDQALVRETRKDYDRSVKIPPDLYQKYVVLTAQSENYWEVCKEKNDYASFQPYLEQIIELTNQMIDLWGVKYTRYDTLLDQYEPGMTVAQLDQIFGDLRDQLVPLAEKISASPAQPRTDFLNQNFDVEQQKQYSLYILKQMGFDFEAGRLDESVHPFATGLNPGDVRITTKYIPNDVTSALFGTIHEGGHAMYEQNLDEQLIGTTLCTGTSMGIHESQSRFWENVIGRSRAFWQANYGELQNKFPQLKDIDMDTFYRGNNIVNPSLIRIEADELTYNLHIIIRYEIEKMIFNEGLKAKDLPKVWNEKYEQYLGVTPPNDAEGVLQDVHWAGGAFGYFPSYSLGNMYAAQFMHTLEQEMPDIWEKVKAGELHPIRDWLSDKIYRYGRMKSPKQLVEEITNESLNPQYLVDYLTEKYADIYQLEQ